MMVADNAIIEISGKKTRSFPMFAYSFRNSCQPHSKCDLSIAIYVRWQQKMFGQNGEPWLSSISREARIIKYLPSFICLHMF